MALAFGANFEPAITHPESFSGPHTCRVVGVRTLLPPSEIDHPPPGRIVYATVFCENVSGPRTQMHVWVTRREALVALDWVPNETMVGVRVVRVDSAAILEATIDERLA